MDVASQSTTALDVASQSAVVAPTMDVASQSAMDVASQSAMDVASQSVSLRVATDCSGLGSPLHALREMGIPCEHLWASDINKHARRMLETACPAREIYTDISSHERVLLPSADLYVVGFPCQLFSAAGLRQGFEGEGGRIFFRVLGVIKATLPKAFLLENVSGLRTINGGACFRKILSRLHKLTDFNIYHDVLNTKDHGVPQNRERCFFVGIRKDVDTGSFEFPEALPLADIRAFLDPREGRPSFADLPPRSQTTARANVQQTLVKLEAKGADPFFEPWVIDCDGTQSFTKAMKGVTPCITAARYKGHWVTSHGRRFNLQEAFRLQGFRIALPSAVSDSQMRHLLGNCMSLNVLRRIFCRLLPAAGLTPPLPDMDAMAR